MAPESMSMLPHCANTLLGCCYESGSLMQNFLGSYERTLESSVVVNQSRSYKKTEIPQVSPENAAIHHITRRSPLSGQGSRTREWTANFRELLGMQIQKRGEGHQNVQNGVIEELICHPSPTCRSGQRVEQQIREANPVPER